VKTGRLDVARAAFEAGLQLSPAHRLMQDWLLEVLLALGDLESAEELAVRYLTSCKQHPRMRQVGH
jgi:TolA-binding protein